MKRNFILMYNRDARSFHHHRMTLESSLKRMEMVGNLRGPAENQRRIVWYDHGKEFPGREVDAPVPFLAMRPTS